MIYSKLWAFIPFTEEAFFHTIIGPTSRFLSVRICNALFAQISDGATLSTLAIFNYFYRSYVATSMK
jgi:hypothetical protein